MTGNSKPQSRCPFNYLPQSEFFKITIEICPLLPQRPHLNKILVYTLYLFYLQFSIIILQIQQIPKLLKVKYTYIYLSFLTCHLFQLLLSRIRYILSETSFNKAPFISSVTLLFYLELNIRKNNLNYAEQIKQYMKKIEEVSQQVSIKSFTRYSMEKSTKLRLGMGLVTLDQRVCTKFMGMMSDVKRSVLL